MNTQNKTNSQLSLQSINSNELLNTVSQFSNLPKQSINLLQTIVVADQSLEICRQLAYKLCNTQMVPKIYQMVGKGQNEAILAAESGAVAILWGCEIGLQPLQALQNVAVINGSPTLWGDALVAIVKASGQCEFLTTTYNEETKTATCTTQRKGEPEEVRSFSWEEAVTAGLTTKRESIYQKYAKRMIMARARSYALRDVYADFLKGFKIREVEQEDKDAEKNITPSGISGLLNFENTDTGEKSKINEQKTNSTNEPINQQTSENELQDFKNYLTSINVAKPEDIDSLREQISNEKRLTVDHLQEVKDVFISRVKFLQENKSDLKR